MAKRGTVSLCIAERAQEGKELYWRRIATYRAAQGEGTEPEFLRLVNYNQDSYILRDPGNLQIQPMLARVLEWGESRGAAFVRQAEDVRVVEVLDVPELRKAKLEHKERLQEQLRSGITLPIYAASSFYAGFCSLVLRLPAGKDGSVQGLLLGSYSEKSLEITPVQEDASRAMLRVKPLPDMSDASGIFMMPVVNLQDAEFIRYERAGEERSREFLRFEPEVLDVNFFPYPAVDYAYSYFRSVLSALVEQNTNLTEKRRLLESDVGPFLDLIAPTLQTVGVFKKFSGTGTNAAAEMMPALQRLLPVLRAQAAVNGKFISALKDIVCEDEAIQTQMLKLVKEEWLAGKDKERQQAESDLALLKSQQAAVRSKIDAVQNELAELEAKRKEAEASNQAVNEALEAIRSAQPILAQAGIPTMVPANIPAPAPVASAPVHGPFVLASQPITASRENPKALSMNLGRFITKEYAGDVSAYITAMLRCGFHLAAEARFARRIAEALSCAKEQRSACVVARMDEDCSTQALLDAINDSESYFVLVEGVLGSARDYQALALARYCRPDRCIIFSLDESDNKELLTTSVYSRIALVDRVPGAYYSERPAPLAALDAAHRGDLVRAESVVTEFKSYIKLDASQDAVQAMLADQLKRVEG